MLSIERLPHCINYVVRASLWKPIQLKKGGSLVSHLFFTDDLVLFVEVSIKQVKIVKICLEVFCATSSQKVNKEKTKMFFSRNVNHNYAKEICNNLGFSSIGDLGKYIGIPLHHRNVTKATYAHLVEKVQNRLQSWSVKTLAMLGRLTLSKFILASLPIYSM